MKLKAKGLEKNIEVNKHFEVENLIEEGETYRISATWEDKI